MDTAKDSRVLVLEDALRRLNEIVDNRKMRVHLEYTRMSEILKAAGTLLYQVKYSYVEPKALAEMDATKRLVSAVADVASIHEAAVKASAYRPKTTKEIEVTAEFSYAVRIAQGFPRRLRECGDDPAYSVDILAVEITELRPVEGSKNLTECRCTDGSHVWRIVTNIRGLKQGVKLPCAVLPPVDMMGVVSEAMFLAGEPLQETIKPGIITSLSTSALDQARAHVLNIIKRMV